jgi:hypothetical protein
MEREFATVRDGQLAPDSPLKWPEGTRLELRPLIDPPSERQSDDETGVRPDFISALNDSDAPGLSESLWPLSNEETQLLIEHMDSATPVFPADNELRQFESDLAASKQLQRELVRANWDAVDPEE